MSWLSNLVHDVVNGFEGKSNGPIVNNPTSPVGTAVNALGTAVNGVSQAVGAVGASTISTVLSNEGVNAGESLADTLILGVIEAGIDKLSPGLQAAIKPAMTAVGTALERAGSTASAA